MGACLVTAYWTPCEKDGFFILELENMAISSQAGTRVDPNLPSYRRGFVSFSAEISGFSIPWRGGVESCSNVLKSLGEEWENYLVKNGAQNVSIFTQYLPM